jgi:uncharacterized protein (TIGR04255 family)
VIPETHEIYPNAPIALVAFEIRFPDGSIGWPVPMPAQRAFRDLLGPEWVIEMQRIQRVNLQVGIGAPPSDVQQMTIPRFTVRDRTVAVALSNESLTIETTRYKNFAAFRVAINSALEAAAKILAPDGVARVGLRYIDEIRVPGMEKENPKDWEEWVDSSLIGPAGPGCSNGLKLIGLQCLAQFETGQDRTLNLRYGPGFGHAVNTEGPLKRPTAPQAGPFFLLDFDSAWQPSDIPEFDAEYLSQLTAELHAPVEALFDSVVTPQLIEIFRQKDEDS